jgi:exopolysaccharide biosynthesis protein
MKFTKTGMTLLILAVLLMTLSLAFAVPSGAITTEADRRYQDEAPGAWDGEDEDFVDGADIGARLSGLPALASAAMSDILPVNDISALDTDIETTGRTPIAANFTENGYRDDTIIVEIQEVRQDDSNYHVAYVKIATASQLRTAVAGGLGSNRTYKTSVLAKSMNAIIAINGDFYTQTKAGFIIRQGEVFRQKTSKNMDLLLIDENGDFHIVLRGHDNQKTEVKRLMSEYKIINGFFFGPALVADGVKQVIPKEYQFNPTGDEPRAAIGQIGPLTYAVVTVDGRIADSSGVSMDELATFMDQIGCEFAYGLDGGNSSALIFGDRMLTVKDVQERSVSDIIYFASATEQGAN